MKNLKLFGHETGIDGNAEPIALSEVSFVASPIVLRSLARFFDDCASALESHELLDHAHFSDFEKGNRAIKVKVVIVNPVAYPKAE